jgi:hypothetical protein
MGSRPLSMKGLVGLLSRLLAQPAFSEDLPSHVHLRAPQKEGLFPAIGQAQR